MNNFTSQQINALDLSKHLLVTANAGSGKTFILTKRFIETIRQRKIKYNQIVAITFTEKAAAELLARISQEIDDYLNKSSTKITDNEFKRLREFRQHILSAKISTIHSFCFDILKEFPVEAEIDPSTKILDELQKTELIRRSIEDTLIENINNEDVREILRTFGKDTTILWLQSLIEKRHFTNETIKKIYLSGDGSSFEKYHNYIKSTAKEYFSQIFSTKLKKAKELLPDIRNELANTNDKETIINSTYELESKIEEFLNQLEFNNLTFIIEEIILKNLLTKDFKVRKKNFKGADETWAISKFQKIIEEFKDFNKNISWDELLEKEKYKSSLVLIDLYNKSKEKFHHLKTLEGALDFDDLLILTNQLLENERVRNELKNRFLFILVDEFQDTDTLQFNIIKKIAGDFESHNNVFVVGDEKQSIYGFRNAQLTVFQNFKNHLRQRHFPSKASGVVTLSASYRTAPSIAAFVNLIFSRLWENKNQIEQKINYHQEVEYSPLQIGREKFSDEPIVFLISKTEENQSQKVANYILYLINSGKEIFDRKLESFRKIDFGDIALLFRERVLMKDFENSFIKNKIPFVVSGGRGFYQSEEIQDWTNYLSFLSNPKNDDSLLAILRSPFFSLSDNQIFGISLEHGDSFLEKLKNYSAKHSDSYFINNVYKILDQHLKVASRYTIPELIQTILKDTLYYGNINFHPKKTQMIANVEKLINAAHNFESSGLQDLKTFSQYLKSAFTKDESPEAVISEIKGSVQMMTMHQSKGLEFPIVILPNFEKELKRSSIKFGEISINDYFGFCYKLTDEEGNNVFTTSSFFGDVMNEWINYNEQLRLLYVALTRATEKLVISFYVNEENKKESPYSYKQILLNQLPELTFNQNDQKTIDTVITFIKKENEMLVEDLKDYKLKLDVITQVPEIIKSEDLDSSENNININKQTELKIFTELINDKVKEEIFTATQLNVYEFCPFKYLLKFIIGYNPNKNYIAEIDEDDFTSGAEIGMIFHQLMEKLNKPSVEEAENILDKILEFYPSSTKYKLKEEVLQKFLPLSKNELFIEIFSNQNSFREFEIRLKLHNHILLGIIDRINFGDNCITIIDYKTDSFSQDNLAKKIEEYKTQMEFYVLLVSEYFEQKDKICLILFFVNFPNKSSIITYKKEDIKRIKEKFVKVLSELEKGNFEKRIEKCKDCEYSRNFKCIVE